MSRLRVCSGMEAVKAFRQPGYEVDHQTGSHYGPQSRQSFFCGQYAPEPHTAGSLLT